MSAHTALEAAAPVARAEAQEVAVIFLFDDAVQHLVVIIIQRDKPERLKNAAWRRADRIEHFGHALYVAGMRLEGHFDEIASAQSLRQLQQATRRGNDLQTGLSAKTVPKLNDGRCGCQLNASSTMQGVDLGIMCHAAHHYGTDDRGKRDYRSPLSGFTCPLGQYRIAA